MKFWEISQLLWKVCNQTSTSSKGSVEMSKVKECPVQGSQKEKCSMLSQCVFSDLVQPLPNSVSC